MSNGEFYTFFMECSINETNEILRKIFANMAMDSGCGHIIKRGPNRYLCVERFMNLKYRMYTIEKSMQDWLLYFLHIKNESLHECKSKH